LASVLRVSFGALTLLVGWQEGHSAFKKRVPVASKGSVPEEIGKKYNVHIYYAGQP